MNQSTQILFEEKEIRKTNGMGAFIAIIALFLIKIALIFVALKSFTAFFQFFFKKTLDSNSV